MHQTQTTFSDVHLCRDLVPSGSADRLPSVDYVCCCGSWSCNGPAEPCRCTGVAMQWNPRVLWGPEHQSGRHYHSFHVIKKNKSQYFLSLFLCFNQYFLSVFFFRFTSAVTDYTYTLAYKSNCVLYAGFYVDTIKLNISIWVLFWFITLSIRVDKYLDIAFAYIFVASQYKTTTINSVKSCTIKINAIKT